MTKERQCRGLEQGMASGFGLTGSAGRCFPVWIDFSEVRMGPAATHYSAAPGWLLKVYCLQCMRDTDNPAKCRELRDDYLECLHHRKEVCSCWYRRPVTSSYPPE